MIAITGAAGFIGSVLVWLFNGRGCSDIVCVDTSPNADHAPNLRPLSYRVYVPHDAFLSSLREGAWPELTAVFHLGACSSTTETNVAYLERNNVQYSKDLCEAALARGARFIHAGSAATYGDGSHGYSDDHTALRVLEPLNAYAASKHAFDLWALDRGLLDHMVVLKYFNVYGPNEWHKGEMRSMVCKGYEQIQRTGRVRLFKSHRPDFRDGEQRRDFVYVKDAVAITAWFLDHPEANGVFNVGSGDAHTWKTLIGAIFSALGSPPSIEYVEMPPELRDRYQYFTVADVRKLRGAGCDVPITPIEDAVAEYVGDHLVPGRHLGSPA